MGQEFTPVCHFVLCIKIETKCEFGVKRHSDVLLVADVCWMLVWRSVVRYIKCTDGFSQWRSALAESSTPS